MLSLFLAIAATTGCHNTVFENKTNQPWDQVDKMHYRAASQRCGELYEKSPCVKLFRKRENRNYSVICGGKSE